MARSAVEIAADIDSFQPVDGEWLGLDALLEELFETENPEAAVDSLFRVFERHPTEDGAGVFWGILHAIESVHGYERHLAKSIRVTPSEFAVIMVNRMLNTGVEDIDGASGRSLMEEVAKNQAIAAQIRETAERLLERHRTT